MKTTTFPSVYNRPAVQQQLARKRKELEDRGIEPYRLIGAAYTPSPARIPSDQEWIQRVVLR